MSKADLSKKPEQVAAMFDEVAPTYDKTNDLLSFGQSRLWRGIVAKAVDPKSGQSVLDMAAGTGSSTAAFAHQPAASPVLQLLPAQGAASVLVVSFEDSRGLCLSV